MFININKILNYNIIYYKNFYDQNIQLRGMGIGDWGFWGYPFLAQ